MIFKNPFKKTVHKEIAVAELENVNVIEEFESDFKGKTTNEIIEEIHESFYTEVDKLLADAKISKSLDTDKQDLINKCERLKNLGFNNTKEVKEAEAEISRLENLKIENESKKTLIEAINYFSFKYPNYKFITEESVKKICAKYNLVYGEIEKYLGTVPDKNLKQMEDFKISEDDECFVNAVFICSTFGIATIDRGYITNKEIQEQNKGLELKREQKQKEGLGYSKFVNRKCPLEIAAPIKDFDMKGAKVKDFKIEIPDPVVLKPVIFQNQKFYLIVTAWGIEASDELVVNQKFN